MWGGASLQKEVEQFNHGVELRAANLVLASGAELVIQILFVSLPCKGLGLGFWKVMHIIVADRWVRLTAWFSLNSHRRSSMLLAVRRSGGRGKLPPVISVRQGGAEKRIITIMPFLIITTS